MWTYVAIAIGGTLGCWARYAQTNLVQAVFGRDFPLATLNINVIGSFLMGFLFIVTLERLMIPQVGGRSDRRSRRIHDLFDFRDGNSPACRGRRVS
jgi:fluoride ion exporter CrcB/FEX